MAKIRFKASKDEETTGGGGGGNFGAAPRGIYELAIESASSGEKTRGGNNPGTPITKFVCIINEDDERGLFGKKVWHNVVWISAGKKGHGMAVHFLHAVGLDYNGDMEIEEENFAGMTFTALLEVETYESKPDARGKTYINEKNTIREIYTDAHPAPAELPPPPKPKAGSKPIARQESLPNIDNGGPEPIEEEAVPF